MKTLELNKEVLRKAWNGAGLCWFSLNSYKLKNISELTYLETPNDVPLTSYLVSIGYIPFFTASNEEVMHAFVDSLSNEKLKKAFAKIDEKDYVESFWKYFNIYPEMSDYNEFEEKYLLEKAKKWCAENSVNYSL